MDKELPVLQQHGLEGTPHFVLVDPDGNIQVDEVGLGGWNQIKKELGE